MIKRFNHITLSMLQKRLETLKDAFPQQYPAALQINRLEDMYALPLIDKEGWVTPLVIGGNIITNSGGTSSGGKTYVYCDMREFVQEATIMAETMAEYLRSNGTHLFLSLVSAGGGWSGGLIVSAAGGVCDRFIGYPAHHPDARTMATLIEEVYLEIRDRIDGIVAMAVPTILVDLAREPEVKKLTWPSQCRVFMYGGDRMTPEQRGVIKQTFPETRIYSYFTSSEANGMGAETEEMGLLKVMPESSFFWLRNAENGSPILQPGITGEAMVSNLYVRYFHLNHHSGDLFEWVTPGETFRFIGRASNLIGGQIKIPAEPLISAILQATQGTGVQFFVTDDYEARIEIANPQKRLPTSAEIIEMIRATSSAANTLRVEKKATFIIKSVTELRRTPHGKIRLVFDERGE